MRRSTLVVLSLALVAAAGCGSGGVREIAAWRAGPPYIPPPEPATRGTKLATRGAQPAAAQKAPTAPRAPSDAQVARELQQAFGTTTKRIVDAAGLTTDGLATVPPSAPARVAAVISAANQVARKPYVYGGGHGRLAGETFVDSAYDCSGSVSFALAAAGFIDTPLDSTALAHFGRPGPGRWVTIFANAGHAWMIVAGLRFDTSGRAQGGSRWTAQPRGTGGFTVRHPPGL